MQGGVYLVAFSCPFKFHNHKYECSGPGKHLVKLGEKTCLDPIVKVF